MKLPDAVSKHRKLIQIAVGVVCLLGALELILSYTMSPADIVIRDHELDTIVVWRDRLDDFQSWRDRLEDYRSSPPPKVLGDRRVFVIGESNAEMLGAPMGDLAPNGVEVVDYGVWDGTLTEVDQLLSLALSLEADEIVLMLGHDLMLPEPPTGFQLTLRELRAHSALLSKLSPDGGITTRGLRDCKGPAERLARLETFMRRFVERTQGERGLGTTVVTVASNLLWPPNGRGAAPVLLDARFAEATQGPQAAIAILKAAPEALASTDPWIAYELGMLQLREGDVPAARKSLQHALSMNCGGGRATPEVNAHIRKLAGELGMRVRDTAQVAAAASAPHDVVGWNVLRDARHLHKDRYWYEAKGVLEVIGVQPKPHRLASVYRPPRPLSNTLKQLIPVVGRGDSIVAERAITSLVWHLLARLGDAANIEIRHSLQTPVGKEAQPRVFAAIAEGYRKAGRLSDAIELSERAEDASGDAPSLWIGRGLTLLQSKAPRDEVQQAFENARKATDDTVAQQATHYLDLLKRSPEVH